MSPTVSVLMPVYNAERYVAAAVESVLAQTLTDMEVLVIDDGSTDRSWAVLERLAGRGDSRIRLTSRPNRGICHTRNELIAQARGEFLAIMDADDLCLPGRLAAQLAHLRANSACVAVGCQAELIDTDGCVIGRWHMPTDHREIDELNLAGRQAVVHPTLFARRATVVALGGYRQNLSEDHDLLLRLAEVGHLANLPDVLLQYRRHSESASHSQPWQLSVATAQALADAYRRRQLPQPSFSPLVDPAPSSPAHNHRTWAWLALNSGRLTTARKHARQAVRQAPLSLASWKVIFCAYRGR